ncbi:Wzz/FepE/Etk N-terminal domain-containing protein [Pseudomonas guariconensis]|uniref:Wzz/FepE/Etk N-terminal domain-containing protein n=1 Tax=Pseudomonas TaxID=286 RepID=UPI002097DB8D|nr:MULTISPECIES: Wzz/FepE/Etk N-terminal domain-containing protein [Pseudomonas]MCO7638968.1 Wzz/FepE/Etk N-terminal domain-containing protein [Pseudomonas sp. S 311-6]MCO7516733.1 Wzz/FepE/Etk N-terminal domain-containing protein [Pseudomonas putida]MCO7565669.1 Wzz/FepE/Etk N-terminal domain-containing protein [Pseudomonas mosselii]MCO7607040.1 Wzz/FepE/Etk N-terminal domain-containing protein [Pseudomonas guariconensis]MCO7617804.1 Wzz/FepE/Etk N-terminal domain-containing protein [Pseudomo
MTNLSRVSLPVFQEEFDFFHITKEVWRRRGIIVATAFGFTLLGAAYAFLATPEYEVRTVLRPAALNELDALNRSGVYELPPRAALTRVGAALDSYDIRLSYFRSRPELVEAYTNLGEAPEQAFSNFNESFKIEQPDPKRLDLLSAFIGLKMRYEKGIDGASYLNDFVSYAIAHERAQIAEDLKGIIANRIREIDAKLESAVGEYNVDKDSRVAKLLEKDAIERAKLQDELKALRVELKLKREARLEQLNESIAIARSLGLKRPATPTSMSEEVVGAANIVRTEVNTQQTPLYFMGSDVLEAERNALRKRSSDDFTEPRIAQIRKQLLMLASNREVEMLQARKNEMLFLEGVESLRSERTRLSGVNTDLNELRLVSVDQYATSPLRPVKPRKTLIIGFALFAGVVIGVFVALLRGMFKARLRHYRDIALMSNVSHEDGRALEGEQLSKSRSGV